MVADQNKYMVDFRSATETRPMFADPPGHYPGLTLTARPAHGAFDEGEHLECE
jgi:hypothetical protein